MLAKILHWLKMRTWMQCGLCKKRIHPQMMFPGNYYWSPFDTIPICQECVPTQIAKRKGGYDPDSKLLKEVDGIINPKSEATDG